MEVLRDTARVNKNDSVQQAEWLSAALLTEELLKIDCAMGLKHRMEL